MLNCWQYRSKDRPSFCDIIEYLEPDLNDEFANHSFYHSDENGVTEDVYDDADDDETGFNSGNDDEDDYSLSRSPQHQQQPLLFGHTPPRASADDEFADFSDVDAQSTHSTLSYDSRRNRFRNSPASNQDSYLQDSAAAGDVRRPYPQLPPRTAASGYTGHEPARPPVAAHLPNAAAGESLRRDPLVLKETAHLWQRPDDSASSRDHSQEQQLHSRATVEPSASADSSKSSGGSGSAGGRNGFKNGHIAQHLAPAAHTSGTDPAC